MSILENLNEIQRTAAKKIYGPSLILAGAGSGKTRTITYKIAYMIKENDINPFSILALTFTNKAANEMKERIENLVGPIAKNMVISTFHSFSVRLLRQYGENIGFSHNFNIYDVDDSKSLIKKIIKDTNCITSLTPSNFYSKISKLKEDEILPEEYAKSVNMEFKDNRIFYEIYKNYQETIIKNNCMDFSDILLNCKNLLEIPKVLELVQDKYRYILVDEYQDTNNIQYQIINSIASKYRNICVVGDEDQSIYAFRGANIQNILNFEKDYKDAFVVKLEQNYRSTPNILNLANSVIKNNTTSLGKKLWTNNPSASNTIVYEATDAYDEAKYICDIIKTSNKPLKDFTILYRTNAQSRILEQELNRNRINCKIFGGLSFYQRKEVKDLLAYLLFLNNPNDIISLERAISNPKRKIGEKTIEKIVNISKEKGVDLLTALKYEGSNKVMEFYNLMMRKYNMLESISITTLINDIIDETNYMEYLNTYDNAEERRLNVFELVNSIEELESVDENISLDEYLTVASLSSSNDGIEDSDYVKLMTIHSSKGLEFDTVFIPGFEKGIFPNDENLEDIKQLEEERRLCYVAITRAKKQLYLIYAKSRNFRGFTDYFKEASYFLSEMDEKYLSFANRKIKEKPKTTIQNISLEYLKNQVSDSNYRIGQIVTHSIYGRGRIKSINPKAMEIEFSVGIKKISTLLADKFLK